MFKKTLIMVAIVATVITVGNEAKIEASASKPALGIDVVVDGMKTTFPDTEPFTDANNNTMVPIRFVSEKLGAKVLWDNNKQVVTLEYNGKNIVMPVGSQNVIVDGVNQTLNTSAIKVEGRVMVPLRFVSETLGTKVDWDQNAVMVNITSPAYQAKIDTKTVKLDAWGRELRDSQTNSFWTTLKDTEDWAYNVKPVDNYNPAFTPATAINVKKDYTKYEADKVGKRIKNYYSTALNIDYRTFNSSNYMSGISGNTYSSWKLSVAKDMETWVKKNKIVVEGYAFPEGQFYYRNGFYHERVKFKFRVISGTDVSQFNMDSWNVSDGSSRPYFIKKGVWYSGYSDVVLSTNSYDTTDGGIVQLFESLRIRYSENMFLEGKSEYKELK